MAARPCAAHQKWWGGVRKSLFSRPWCAVWPLFYHERFSRGGLPQAVYVKPETQAPQLLNSSHHAPSRAARPHRGNGSCIHERCLENSLQTEQSVALVMQPMGLIGRWLLLVCWDKCISVGVEREVGGVFKAACRERETTRTGENGSGMTGRLDLSAYRIYSSSQSWSWGGILVCIVACFVSKMTVSFQTDYSWFCKPFLNFCFVLVSLFF